MYDIGWDHPRNDRALKHASDSCTRTHALHVFHLTKLHNHQYIPRASRVRTNCYSQSASRPFSTTASNLSAGRAALLFNFSAWLFSTDCFVMFDRPCSTDIIAISALKTAPRRAQPTSSHSAHQQSAVPSAWQPAQAGRFSASCAFVMDSHVQHQPHQSRRSLSCKAMMTPGRGIRKKETHVRHIASP